MICRLSHFARTRVYFKNIENIKLHRKISNFNAEQLYQGHVFDMSVRSQIRIEFIAHKADCSISKPRFFFLFISHAHLVHACPANRREYSSWRVIRERFTIYTPVIMSALTPLSRHDLNDFKTEREKYN